MNNSIKQLLALVALSSVMFTGIASAMDPERTQRLHFTKYTTGTPDLVQAFPNNNELHFVNTPLSLNDLRNTILDSSEDREFMNFSDNKRKPTPEEKIEIKRAWKIINDAKAGIIKPEPWTAEQYRKASQMMAQKRKRNQAPKEELAPKRRKVETNNESK